MKPTDTPRVLPLEQPGKFYHKRARKKLDQMAYLRALSLLREAVRREPDNMDYRMDLAETLTEMSLFDASNRMLYHMLHAEAPRVDCFFGLGCNYIGLQEYDRAREAFLMYLKNDAEGEYAEDAEELLEWLDLSFAESDNLPPRIRQALRAGKQSLDEGAYETAVRQLTRVLTHAPETAAARNNLSLALHCLRRTDEAMQHAEAVLAEHPTDVHALCNMAMFYHAQGRRGEAMMRLEGLEVSPPTEAEEQYKLAAIYVEIECDERALTRARALVATAPFDKQALHLLAVAHHNCGNTREAEECWQRILRVDPEDAVALWYLQEARRQDALPARLSARYQLPYEEVLVRIRAINNMASEGVEAMKRRWRDEPDFKRLIAWGIGMSDRSIKLALLHIVSLFADEEAEGILRGFLTRHDESDEVKREVFGMLKQMDAQEPYLAIIEDALVEVRVNATRLEGAMPHGYDDILRETIASMAARYPEEEFMQAVIKLWVEYATSLGDKPPRIQNKAAWCSALEGAYWRAEGKPRMLSSVARLWEVRLQTTRLFSARILAARGKGEA